jgi:hypothetical protein
MGGTAMTPSQFLFLSEQAARNGFHVVNLSYANADAVQIVCGTDPDNSCFENVRQEVIDGTDRTTKVAVNRANSLENRLIKLLEHLRSKYPTDGWADYMEGSGPRWNSIVLSGHSQGGGHAALIAKSRSVARVALLASPVDNIGPFARQVGSTWPAPWLLGPHVTPSERYFAFGHAQDGISDWGLQWKAQGLGLTDFGPIVNVDEETPPYRNSHTLMTNATPRPPVTPHNSVSVDAGTPVGPNGQPLFAPVWQYICFS